MKSSLLKLPVGVDSFEKIRKDGFYYVDKTTLIEQLLEQWGEVNLFTRPRRFGKTLNMSMLRCFFEIGADRSLFDGLDISKNQELCNTYMGKFPVVFLSLKNVDGLTFADAKYRLTELVAAEAERFLFLSDSKKLSENEANQRTGIKNLPEECHRKVHCCCLEPCGNDLTCRCMFDQHSCRKAHTWTHKCNGYC